ncbi:MAG: Uncharacterized protein Greene041662_76 [Candidatus Peregrinibacteria bacterium Greene0416_62]|nr:MAG: Uncharacterized protein Greene041662_76 [Candidatus Peregrinibacteria bacterium Greene0416_62]TSC98641.1 MAG: Uncharacterized protein Greene101449_906 [Candidatus Peregrinibacteria bacterium Greene1014_49]
MRLLRCRVATVILHLRTFFTRIWLCCTNPSSYKELRGKSFWSGFWYLYWLLVVTTFMSAVIFAVQAKVYMPKIHTWIADAKETVPDLYPVDLVLTLSGGQLSTNVEQPYVFPLPPAWEAAMLVIQEDEGGDNNNGVIKHLLMIDTAATVEDYPQYETLVLLTKKAAIGRDKNGLKVLLYSQYQKENVPPMVFTRKVYEEVTAKALPFLDYLPTIVISLVISGVLLFPWFLALFGVLGYLLYLLIVTLLSWIIAAMMKRTFTYGELYCLGFYGLTPAIVIGWVLERLNVGFSMLFTVIFLVTMGMVVRAFTSSTATGVRPIGVQKKKSGKGK